MSEYVSTTEQEMIQVATTSGWGDFCDWVRETDVDDFPWLHSLVTFGFANDAAMLSDEIEGAIRKGKPSNDVKDVATGLLEFLGDHQDAEIIVISNGMTSDDGDAS
jgi:hypothetical protein